MAIWLPLFGDWGILLTPMGSSRKLNIKLPIQRFSCSYFEPFATGKVLVSTCQIKCFSCASDKYPESVEMAWTSFGSKGHVSREKKTLIVWVLIVLLFGYWVVFRGLTKAF